MTRKLSKQKKKLEEKKAKQHKELVTSALFEDFSLQYL